MGSANSTSLPTGRVPPTCCQTLCEETTALFQLPEVWTPGKILQRQENMCQLRQSRRTCRLHCRCLVPKLQGKWTQCSLQRLHQVPTRRIDLEDNGRTWRFIHPCSRYPLSETSQTKLCTGSFSE